MDDIETIFHKFKSSTLRPTQQKNIANFKNLNVKTKGGLRNRETDQIADLKP